MDDRNGGRLEMGTRTYLVVIDETEEARLALRFASQRASKTGGLVLILALVPRQDFLAWGGVQATMVDEARGRAEALLNSAAGEIFAESGVRPAIMVKSGNASKVIREVIDDHGEVAALVLATAASGPPGPLVKHFTGQNSGTLPCPVMVIPGSLSQEALDRIT